jgi:hypothetical protein
MIYIVSLIAFAIGLTLPDIDLAPTLPIRHRSAWTHGPWFAIATWYLAPQFVEWQWALVAFMVGMAIHLLKDAFPKSWHGSAHISGFPLAFTLNGLMSFIYIMASAAASAWVAWSILAT